MGTTRPTAPAAPASGKLGRGGGTEESGERALAGAAGAVGLVVEWTEAEIGSGKIYVRFFLSWRDRNQATASGSDLWDPADTSYLRWELSVHHLLRSMKPRRSELLYLYPRQTPIAPARDAAIGPEGCALRFSKGRFYRGAFNLTMVARKGRRTLRLSLHCEMKLLCGVFMSSGIDSCF